MKIEFVIAERFNGTFRVRTDGLMRRGRPELELYDVPVGQLDAARELLARVAESVVERPVAIGRPLQLRGDLSVELKEGEHIQAGKYARGFGPLERTVLRVTDEGAKNAARSLGHICGGFRAVNVDACSTTSMSVTGA